MDLTFANLHLLYNSTHSVVLKRSLEWNPRVTGFGVPTAGRKCWQCPLAQLYAVQLKAQSTICFPSGASIDIFPFHGEYCSSYEWLNNLFRPHPEPKFILKEPEVNYAALLFAPSAAHPKAPAAPLQYGSHCLLFGSCWCSRSWARLCRQWFFVIVLSSLLSRDM